MVKHLNNNNHRIGREPLAENDVTVSKTFKAPGSFWAEAQKRSDELGFKFFGEFVRYALQQEIWRQDELRALLMQQLNGYKNENIALRDQIKGRKRRED